MRKRDLIALFSIVGLIDAYYIEHERRDTVHFVIYVTASPISIVKKSNSALVNEFGSRDFLFFGISSYNLIADLGI
jgi:hypothetical protein